MKLEYMGERSSSIKKKIVKEKRNWMLEHRKPGIKLICQTLSLFLPITEAVNAMTSVEYRKNRKLSKTAKSYNRKTAH